MCETTYFFYKKSSGDKYFLKFKNLRQRKHKGKCPETFKKGFKTIRFVEFANYRAQITHFRAKISINDNCTCTELGIWD